MEKQAFSPKELAMLASCGTTDPSATRMVIPTVHGPMETRIIEAREGLAITLAIFGEPPKPQEGYFAISHLRTGLTPVGLMGGIELARDIMESLLEIGTWDLSMEEIAASKEHGSQAALTRALFEEWDE